ncbi:MAG: hydroxymethylbilane synthase [Panacibacter sp.]
MSKVFRIGTRDSQLAVWQATLVQQQLAANNTKSELVYIKSDGDIDLITPLYEIGVQGIFTKTLDAALLGKRIDIAVHSMKDVPTQLAAGIAQAAVLPRASYKDILVFKGKKNFLRDYSSPAVIATSSIRRQAQWLHRYPHHTIENLRGNINTRLKKVTESNWNGAIFAAAGLERINLRPENSLELDWMLPAPSQGAIMVVCRQEDHEAKEACGILNDTATGLCTKIEKDFLKALMGGCSTPISALAEIHNGIVDFKGNIFSLDGKEKAEIEKKIDIKNAINSGTEAAVELLNNGGRKISEAIRNAKK